MSQHEKEEIHILVVHLLTELPSSTSSSTSSSSSSSSSSSGCHINIYIPFTKSDWNISIQILKACLIDLLEYASGMKGESIENVTNEFIDNNNNNSNNSHNHHESEVCRRIYVYKVLKSSIISWKHNLLLQDNNELDTILIKTKSDTSLKQLLPQLKKNINRLCLVVGDSSSSSLAHYDNWCLDEDKSLSYFASWLFDSPRLISAATDNGIETFGTTKLGNEIEEAKSLQDTHRSTTTLASELGTEALTMSTQDTIGRKSGGFDSGTESELKSLQDTHVDKSPSLTPETHFMLTYANFMPPPTIRIIIQESRTAADMYNKSYTIYSLVIRQGGLEWTVERRYSDFAKLHESLLAQPPSDTGYIDKANLPHLPSKKLTSSKSLDPQTVQKRRIKLAKYINDLVTKDKALSNHLILSFIGLLNTARFDSVQPSKGRSRNAIHVSKLKVEAKWGDIILFKCANTLSHLQRKVTQSEWDHVGLVVPSLNPASKSGGLELLEATGEGVTSYPLAARLKAYYVNQFTKYMCVRQLHLRDRTPELMNRLLQFTKHVVGKPYGFSAAQIFPRKNVSQKSNKAFGHAMCCLKATNRASEEEEDDENNPRLFISMNDSTKSDAEDAEPTSYFCSELVAAALKEIEIIPPYLNAGYFWPGSFATGGEIDHVLAGSGASYGEELVIDCRVIEISRAVPKTYDPVIVNSGVTKYSTTTTEEFKSSQHPNTNHHHPHGTMTKQYSDHITGVDDINDNMSVNSRYVLSKVFDNDTLIPKSAPLDGKLFHADSENSSLESSSTIEGRERNNSSNPLMEWRNSETIQHAFDGDEDVDEADQLISGTSGHGKVKHVYSTDEKLKDPSSSSDSVLKKPSSQNLKSLGSATVLPHADTMPLSMEHDPDDDDDDDDVIVHAPKATFVPTLF